MSKQSSKRDVSVVFDLHRVLRKRSPKAMLFSIFAVALLLIGPLSLVIAGIGESSADDRYVGNKITITYYPGEKPTNIDGSLNGSPNGSDNYSPISVTYYGDFASTEYNPQYWSNNVADGGSSALSKVNLEKWYPIKSYKEGETIVFTGWVDKNDFKYDPGDIITDSEVELYATWDTLLKFTDEQHANSLSQGMDLYRHIVKDLTINGTQYGAGSIGGTSAYVNGNYTLRNCVINVDNSYLDIKGKTIIDNTVIAGMKGSDNHGAGFPGIFANGNKLIIGSDVKGTPNGSTEANYAQIFGGSKTGDCDSTNLIIHSGTFSNVVSGSQSGKVKRDTKVILKDVTILDTLTAGVVSEVGGSTYTYATAINMPGDSYEEGKLGGNDLPKGVTLTESTIITGGCNRSKVAGDTHVFISGTSKIWDVQGAGRGGGSSVNKSNVTIGGKAIVKHIVAGSIQTGYMKKILVTKNVSIIRI